MKIALLDDYQRAGPWQTGLTEGLAGKRLGLLGLGKLGTQVARVGRAFGMEVVAWSQNLTDARASEVGARRVEKQELFATADVVSLHLILSERTRGPPPGASTPRGPGWWRSRRCWLPRCVGGHPRVAGRWAGAAAPLRAS